MMTFLATIEEQTDGAVAHRVLNDGRVVCLYRNIFTWRLCIGPVGVGWYDDGWCYPLESLNAALDAVHAWDGNGDPPDGWSRHLRSGRRRPDGDPTREFVNP